MKRSRGNGSSLTGGTGDVNPQTMVVRVTESAADTTTTQSQAVPVQRLQDKGKAQVMEVLRVIFNVNTFAEVDASITACLTTRNFGTTAVGTNDPSMIAFYQLAVRLTTSGQYSQVQPFFYDCTDGAGHGMLVATDQIFLQAQSATTGVAVVCDARILYRWKNVTVQEYVGIVQSQQ
jgi:hypothetical protein